MKKNEAIIQKAKDFVTAYMGRELSVEMKFHDMNHTLDVWNAVKKIAEEEGLSEIEKKRLELAALFHDLGYTKIYNGHEEAGVELAKEYLLKENHPESEIALIGDLILATKMGVKPKSRLEEIIRDADMNHLASKKYKKYSRALLHEWKYFCRKDYTEGDWTAMNFSFLENHQYYTEAAKKIFQAGKDKNFKKLTKMKAVKQKPKTNAALAGSKSAQMAFKTALRNHIDLTALADNKANIMLSVNAILITISIPYMPGYIRENPMLLIPASILIITSISSVIAATLATRPIKMSGKSNPDKIKTGAANLFFFGNYYKMKKEDYMVAITEVINDEAILEKSVISDLFHLGSSLGRKYKMLRICYTIFMLGMCLTVIASILIHCF